MIPFFFRMRVTQLLPKFHWMKKQRLTIGPSLAKFDTMDIQATS